MPNIADEHIQNAMDDGAFDNLPGQGKPLRLEDERFVPPDMRLAYRIMRDNDIQPVWIAEQKELNQMIDEARQHLRGAAHQHALIQKRLAGRRDLQSVKERIAAEDHFSNVQAHFKDRLRVINKKIDVYNLKVPASHLTRDHLLAEQEIRKILAES